MWIIGHIVLYIYISVAYIWIRSVYCGEYIHTVLVENSSTPKLMYYTSTWFSSLLDLRNADKAIFRGKYTVMVYQSKR
jgi:hypothetical protein